jgi:hypothetical protein
MAFKEVRDALLVQLALPLNLSNLLGSSQSLHKDFEQRRTKRPRQITRLKRLLNP